MRISENCGRFFRTIVLSILNISISVFSPYLRKFENGLLGSPIWSYLVKFYYRNHNTWDEVKYAFLIKWKYNVSWNTKPFAELNMIFENTRRSRMEIWSRRRRKKSVQSKRKWKQSPSQNQRSSLRGGNSCIQNAERNENDVIQVDFGWLCQIKFSNSDVCFCTYFLKESQISKLGTWWKFSEVLRKQEKWMI